MKKNDAADTPLLYHLRDLRKRLVHILIAVAVCLCVCLYFAKDLYHILAIPMLKVLPAQSSFITTHPIEAWLTYFKTGLLAAVFLATPVIFFELWEFISPGLYKNEKKFTLLFVSFSTLLFICGALFGYYVIFPWGYEYFVGFLDGADARFLPSMKEYFGFSCRLLLAFGIIFELPLLVFLMAVSKIVPLKTLFGIQKYVIVVAFIVAAILTPPDVITQIFLAIPLILLYQIGLLAAWFVLRLSRKPLAF